MSLLGSLLPGFLGSINPANIIKGIINTGTGILENISKGAPVDISGNLARGLKTAIGADQSAIGSIGGQAQMEPSASEKLNGIQNAANLVNTERMNRISGDLHNSIARNAANLRGIYSEDRTRYGGHTGGAPVNEVVPLEQAVESAPGGMPDRRIAIVHTDRRRVPAADLLNARDQYGYKSIPVAMTGVRPVNTAISQAEPSGESSAEPPEPKPKPKKKLVVSKFKAKRPAKKGKGRGRK